MSELQSEREDLSTVAVSPQVYYEYETRFIRQKLERDRMRLLPHVVVPEMFASGGHALGDIRVFERFTAGPISAMTCRFIDLAADESTPWERRIPTLLAYVVSGDGVLAVGDDVHGLSAGDVFVVPPYTEYSVRAGTSGLRAFVPENRLWHVLGLLWHEHLEPQRMPGEVETQTTANGEWAGYRFPKGMLGLEEDLVVAKGGEPHRSTVFAARRASGDVPVGATQYDHFLRLMSQENEIEQAQARVIREAEVPLEDTRQGRLRYFVSYWTPMVGKDLELATYDIPVGARTGRHRHIPEELLYVVQGSGYDLHDGTRHEWRAGDLICIPPMTEHQHVNDGVEPARLVSVWLNHPANEFLGGIEHIEDASTWGAP
jgi:quercetin dioxygenase-like cupin family protein